MKNCRYDSDNYLGLLMTKKNLGYKTFWIFSFLMLLSCAPNSSGSGSGNNSPQSDGITKPSDAKIYLYQTTFYISGSGLGSRTQSNAACHGAHLVYAPPTTCNQFLAVVLYAAEKNLDQLFTEQHVPLASSIFLLDGSRQVSDSINNLFKAAPPISMGEYGVPDRFFWSGYQQATGLVSNNCGDWKNSTSTASVGSLQDNIALSGWANMNVQCTSSTQRLMCLCW